MALKKQLKNYKANSNKVKKEYNKIKKNIRFTKIKE